MKIILSQRIDTDTDYEDVPFETYHFPKRYRTQIRPGDRFIYYQGNRYKRLILPFGFKKNRPPD